MSEPPRVEVGEASDGRIPVSAGGERFTAYLREEVASVLKKPVLYPLESAAGVGVSRGFPLDPRPGERVDHPHHIGCWLNYGHVNGLDFWNNSDAVSAERQADMGEIVHREVRGRESGAGRGELDVTMDWLGPDGEAILREETDFVFRADADTRAVDRTTRLTALTDVDLEDDKEGMLGVRVTKELEHPDDGEITAVGEDGDTAEIPGDRDRTGEYLSSEGVRGVDAWGTRAEWMALSGTVEGSDVAVAIMDHPDNVGHPTYWHARGYGLFAANPLGQSVFSDGEEHLGYALVEDESTTFRHRIAVIDGHPDGDELDGRYEAFVDAV